jgi:hypothetical protein
LRKIGGVARRDYLCVRVLPEDESRQFSADEFALSVSRWHKYHQAPDFFGYKTVKVFAKYGMVPVKPITRVGIDCKICKASAGKYQLGSLRVILR